MDDPKDNWEALFNHNYLRWFHLNGSPALVEIVEVTPNIELTLPGGAKSIKPVLYYRQIQGKLEQADREVKKTVNGKATVEIVHGFRPLVLNVTNGNSIATAHGPKWKLWAGKQIVLFQDEIRMFDKDTRQMVTSSCVRIRAPDAASSKASQPTEQKAANHDGEVTELCLRYTKVADKSGLSECSAEAKRLWPLIDLASQKLITQRSDEAKARISPPKEPEPAAPGDPTDAQLKLAEAMSILINATKASSALRSIATDVIDHLGEKKLTADQANTLMEMIEEKTK